MNASVTCHYSQFISEPGNAFSFRGVVEALPEVGARSACCSDAPDDFREKADDLTGVGGSEAASYSFLIASSRVLSL